MILATTCEMIQGRAGCHSRRAERGWDFGGDLSDLGRDRLAGLAARQAVGRDLRAREQLVGFFVLVASLGQGIKAAAITAGLEPRQAVRFRDGTGWWKYGRVVIFFRF